MFTQIFLITIGFTAICLVLDSKTGKMVEKALREFALPKR